MKQNIDDDERYCLEATTLTLALNEVVMDLAISGDGRHHLWQSEWESVAFVHLPEMECLPIRLANLLQVAPLDRARHSRHEQDPTLHFVLMRVPQRLLIVGQCEEEVLSNYVLHSDQVSPRFWAVVDQALPHLFVLVRTVMVCFHLSAHIGPIEMEPAQVENTALLS